MMPNQQWQLADGIVPGGGGSYTCRYFKFKFRKGGTGNAIGEVFVYDSEMNNVAQGKTVTVTLGDSSGKTQIVDGAYNSYEYNWWDASTTDPEFVIDLGAEYAVSDYSVASHASNAADINWAPADFDIYFSADNIDYTLVQEQRGLFWAYAEKKDFYI